MVGVLPSLDRSLARLADIAKAIGLPFDVTKMRETWLSQYHVPPDAAKAVDLAAPLAFVVLPAPSPDKSPETTVALQLASAKLAKQASGALGKSIATQDDAASFQLADGTVFWLWRKDRHVVVSTSLDALIAGANLALASLAKSEDDLLVTIHPEAIAKSRGTNLKSAMAAWAKEITEADHTSAADATLPAFMGPIAAYLGGQVVDIDEASLSVRIDPKLGGTITAVAKPKLGSSLAKRLAKSAPYVLDPVVLTGSDPSMLAASSPSSWMTEAWRALAPTLTRQQAIAGLVKPLKTLLTSTTGAFSMSTQLAGGQRQQIGTYELAPGTSADAYLAQLVALGKSPEVAKLLATLDMKIELDLVKDKTIVAGALIFDIGKMPAYQRKTLTSLVGDKIPFAVGVKQRRVLLVTGKDARGRLAKLDRADAAKVSPPAQVAAMLAETRSADGFVYIDVMQSLRAALDASPMHQTLGRSPIPSSMPTWLSYGGGQTFTLTWRIPMSAVRGAGSIAPMFMMLGAGAGGGIP